MAASDGGSTGPVKARPLVLGHRGARLEAPENTLPAFRRALELGADGVELDVRMAADGEVIAFHDAQLERTTDGRGPVARANLTELRRLDAGTHFSPDFAGTRICTLAEALEVLAPAVLVNVELKGPAGRDTGLERRALGVVREAGMVDQVIFSSFHPLHLNRLRRLDRDIALAWLYDPGLLRGAVLLLARGLHLRALHPARRAVTRRTVEQAHRHGLQVVPWTVNEKDDVCLLLAWGVDGLITDRPGQVRGWVDASAAAGHG